MPYVTYASTSPYANTSQTNFSLGLIDWRPVPPADDDSLAVLGMHHQYRPDTLSYELYSSPAYWWVFCVRNPVLRADPIWNFVAGLNIIVPSLATINKVCGS